MMIRPSNQAGFTIIELIMVICMIAIVMAFAGPSLDGYTREMKTKAVARDIYTMLQQAKITAIRDNKTIIAVFTPAGTNGNPYGSLIIRDPSIADPTKKVIASLDLSSSAELRGVKIGPPGNLFNISFTPRGTATNRSFEVKHIDTGIAGYRIYTNLTGGIRLEKL
ncbi:MAG: hypothetical protein COZ95_01850 [Nitrospirae bacterium CG_4_8_14_3_um_filter_50_41]|nr:MAG: hypothetical protein COZ95_01850 [Nitrospirae bacterium CG_4_8_14_3_um_filter_50_41]